MRDVHNDLEVRCGLMASLGSALGMYDSDHGRGDRKVGLNSPREAGGLKSAGASTSGTEEAFLRFDAAAEGRAFDQNHAFLRLGYLLGERLRVEGGYLDQYDVPERGRAREVSHVLQIAIYSDAPLALRGR